MPKKNSSTQLDNNEKERNEAPLKKQKQPPVIKDLGKFVSSASPEKLAKYQKLKTVFMLLSTLLFAINLILPVVGRVKVNDILWANTLYLLFDIFIIVLSVYISYQGTKRQKIRGEVLFQDAPRGGFKKHTYFTFELFNIVHIILVPLEIYIAFLSLNIDGWGILNIFVISGSAAFSIISRQYLFRANYKSMEFFPPILPDQLPEENESKPNE